ncbi:MAG: magnesium-translocating P-type ATPase [Patescibacteria group bacterium]|nr:magnesium-translocating P-type ATPase [Patescibacteria group bacterium]
MNDSSNTKIKPIPPQPKSSRPDQIKSERLRIAASEEIIKTLKSLQSSPDGITNDEAASRLASNGPNTIASQQSKSWFKKFLTNFRDPLSLLLLALGLISYFTGEIKAAIIIGAMLILSVLLRFVQEMRADKAAKKLKAMVHTTTAVRRAGHRYDLPLDEIVPGDIIELSAGDMVPADLRLIESKDLFVNQATLTGESLPAEKHAPPLTDTSGSVFGFQNLCFMGTNVESGSATAIVVTTGSQTCFGSLAKTIAVDRQTTSFDRGVGRFTWLMIRFIAIMVPLVFVINGFSKGNWLEAFLFALAVAVGLTPELLPMIVTVNLSKGALDMSRKKVIVKRLNAIQNFGAMDILCTDKTGTLTQGHVVLIKHLDISGKENVKILNYAYLNSHYQTGLKNLMDDAILRHDTEETSALVREYKKIDEIPFDFVRRRMSVVVEIGAGEHLLICKGAVEEVLARSRWVEVNGQIKKLEKHHHVSKNELVNQLSAEGFRMIALSYRKMPLTKQVYDVADEKDLILVGFLAFLDPPKETAATAIKELERHGVRIKVLTGDNELVTRKICTEVGLPIKRILLGTEVEKMDDAELAIAAEEATVFDKLEPMQKERIIHALQSRGHAVGYLGDGINDAPALKAADVGISVDSAVDIAQESSDIILLEKSLMVLKDGVREGRKIFGNIIKYIKMTASSNFGNMFSVVGGSIFLPFLPMLPLQVITNNLLYDMSQVTIPTDGVDEEYLIQPRQWKISLIKKFILWLGPVSSLFDYATYFLMLYVFHAWSDPALFHTGWFVESLMTQTLIIHVIRTRKIPFFQSRASLPLTLTSFLVVGFGAWLPFSPLAGALGFKPLPPTYWLYMLGFLFLYFCLAQLVKKWFIRRYGWE